jgi:hypothetical protein
MTSLLERGSIATKPLILLTSSGNGNVLSAKREKGPIVRPLFSYSTVLTSSALAARALRG